MSCSPDFIIIRRDTSTFQVNFADESGNPIDITGCAVFFTVKKKLEDVDADALISKTVYAHTDPTHGRTLITLTSSDTDHPAGVYFWDLQLRDGNGNIASTQFGRMKITQDVTIRIS